MSIPPLLPSLEAFEDKLTCLLGRTLNENPRAPFSANLVSPRSTISLWQRYSYLYLLCSDR